MARITQALQLKDADGNPAGLWRMVTTSDEDASVFEPCCDHDTHDSPTAAANCPDYVAGNSLRNATAKSKQRKADRDSLLEAVRQFQTKKWTPEGPELEGFMNQVETYLEGEE